MIVGESFIHIIYREMYHSVLHDNDVRNEAARVEIGRFLDFPIHPRERFQAILVYLYTIY